MTSVSRSTLAAAALTLLLGGVAARAEATFHRDMAAAYRKAHPDAKSGARNPWTVEMEKHCMATVKDAEKLATDAEWAARFHEHRALEIEGK